MGWTFAIEIKSLKKLLPLPFRGKLSLKVFFADDLNYIIGGKKENYFEETSTEI